MNRTPKGMKICSARLKVRRNTVASIPIQLRQQDITAVPETAVSVSKHSRLQ
jgi:hypothetical protein